MRSDHFITELESTACFRQEFPFRSRYLEVDGNRVHYVDEGTGPILLLLHGNPTFSFLYRHMIKGLKDRFRVIALDYPGFGLSIAREGYDFLPRSHSKILDEFAQRLEIRKCSIFVQDWGGPIGLGFAGRNPELIERLIIGNTWAWLVNGDFHFESFSRIMGGAIGRFFIVRNNAFVNLLLPAGTPKNKIKKDILNIYRTAMPAHRRIATSIFPREIIAGKAFLQSVEAGLKSLSDRKVLFLWGDKDIAFRKIELKRFESLFPDHETVILEGAGHYIQEEVPDLIVDRIRAWWQP
jgi:haloalkane dehalogenase